MRILLCTTFLLTTSVFSLFATHNRGGEITFRHIAGSTYEVTIHTYTRASSTPADRDTLNLNWGDGTVDKLLRSNGPVMGGGHQGVVLAGADDIKYNEYKSSPHTFPGTGNYYISVEDPNRVSNIININGGASVNMQLYIESLLRVGLDCPNNSAQFAKEPIFITNVNHTFVHNPAAFDTDGDSLSFELIAPLQDHDFPVPNYEYPDEITPGINNSFAINPVSGTITWDSPQLVGTYSIAVKVNEWKNGWLAGYVIRDFHVIVEDENFSPVQFSGLNNWQMDSSENFIAQLNPYDTLALAFSILNSDSVSAFGEFFLGANTASFSNTIGSNPDSASLTWIPDSMRARISPYVTVFRASQTINGITLKTDLPLLIYVSGGERSQCVNSVFSGIKEEVNQNLIRVFPNPMERYAEIQIPENIPLISGIEFKLYDMTGRNLLEELLDSHTLRIQRNNLTAGIYFYSFRGEDIFLTGKLAVK